MSKVDDARKSVQFARAIVTGEIAGGEGEVVAFLSDALQLLDQATQAVQSAQEVYDDQPDLTKLAEDAEHGRISYGEYDTTCFDVWNDSHDTLGVLLEAL